MDELNFDKLHEECGVFGIYSPSESDVAMKTYYGIFGKRTNCRRPRALRYEDHGKPSECTAHDCKS